MARDLKQSLGVALADQKKRKRHHQPARNKRGPSKAEKAEKARQAKVIDDAIAKGDEMILASVIPAAQLAHGDFGLVNHTMVETVHRGKIKQHTVKVIRNLGGTPVERWFNRGKLDDRQMAAILFYQHAWRMWIGEPRVVANWDAVIVRQAQGAIEIWSGSRLAAKESLRLLDQEVFFREPVEQFQVWQNVVIWDEPAGVAGSRIGFCHKPAEAIAQYIVGSLAHKVAEVVIDSSKRDFGDLILDLDKPRAPRGR